MNSPEVLHGDGEIKSFSQQVPDKGQAITSGMEAEVWIL